MIKKNRENVWTDNKPRAKQIQAMYLPVRKMLLQLTDDQIKTIADKLPPVKKDLFLNRVVKIARDGDNYDALNDIAKRNKCTRQNIFLLERSLISELISNFYSFQTRQVR